MNSSSELLVYKASAGSGKTFTLAIEYIKLLIKNPRAYQQILAVTFTNKATAEMKERILSQLYGIWTSDKDSEAYLENVCKGLSMSEDDVRKAAGVALNYMIHDYNRFRVETIDSFFQSVMRNLARELELSPGLNIELNNTEVLSDAVDSMVEKLRPGSSVLVWLLEYINERIADDKKWNVSDEVKSFGRNIFDEGYMEKGEGLRLKLKDKNYIGNYSKELQHILTEALEQMKGFPEQFFGILEESGLKADDLKNGSRGIGSYFNKIQNESLGDDIRNTTVEKCLEDSSHWATKTSPYKSQILELASSQLMPLLEDTERFRSKNNVIVNTCRLSLQHLNKVRLLTNIDEEVRKLNRENNRFLLSDTNALLHKLVRDGDSSFVFEKIGANIRNVMIDEFQDTSRMQWENFKLLLLEGLSQGANSLIVGDVKQSIYRWRNGDWGILNGLQKNIDHFPIRVETLKINRRSETNIIQFNNDIFTAACEYLNDIYKSELNEDCESLLKAYSDVKQKSPKKKDKGYVRTTFLRADEELTYTDVTLNEMGTCIYEIITQGVNPSDITILVRKNKSIPQIADYFDKELHYKIVSDEAFRLDASLAICMIMDALRYLSDLSNGIAKGQLITAYQNDVLQSNIDINTLLMNHDDLYLPEGFTKNISSLRLMPLYELIEELFVIFEMNKINEQDAYLFSFFDAVVDYLQSHSSDLDTFISFWDDNLCSKTIPSGEIEGIRIMSIHKSKGLEFHTVVIPFCDWKLENETNNQLVWCSPSTAPFNNLDIVPVNYSSAMEQSLYREQYLNERLQLWVDNLNLLYVAFTRAAKNLIIYAKAGQKNTVSELLSHSLSMITSSEDTEWNADEIYDYGKLCISEQEKESTSTNKLIIKPNKLKIKMESLKNKIGFKQSNRSADFIKGEDYEALDTQYIDRGRLYHNLFAGIKTFADIDTAIKQLIFEGLVSDKETESEIRQKTEEALSLPMVKEWYSGTYNLFNECAIIYNDESDTLQTRRPDRVMMKDNEVIVVDFKFGKKNKKYDEQVKGYMDLLSQMGYTGIKGYVWYVFEKELEVVK